MFLETICLINGKVQNLDAHIRRMRKTADYFRFDVPELPDLEELLSPGMENCKVKCSIHYHYEINSIAFVTFKACVIISGPIPSPGNTAIFNFIILVIF
jgi:4-amino-4-deoxychorismate lyase